MAHPKFVFQPNNLFYSFVYCDYDNFYALFVKKTVLLMSEHQCGPGFVTLALDCKKY
jgi:hypothetical protein